LGVTRVELGVQTPSNKVYNLIGRRHKVEDVVEATRVLKDAGMKVLYHLMPGLPGSDYQADLEAFKKVFSDANFKPDMIKIYPCLVIEGTELSEMWRKGVYNPYSTEDAIRLISNIKEFIPPWVRIMRVQRDIPSQLVEAGVKKSNLRQLVKKRLSQLGKACRCIRCREVGHKQPKLKTDLSPEYIQVLSEEEEASEGVDVFISAEEPVSDVLIGYLRLRIPSSRAHRPEIVPACSSIVRELHVCGALAPVGERPPDAWQHKGYGSTLLEAAEEKSKEYGKSKVVVISGLGAKRYFKRRGYKHDGPYMSKVLE
jgi:elongator complex protein 3